MDELPSTPQPRSVLALKLGLLVAWAVVSFGSVFFARSLDFEILGWPFGYWLAAQGALLAFVAIVAAYAWAMQRLQPGDAVPDAEAPEATR
jgi:putative solute:sodium symporter small subunit